MSDRSSRRWKLIVGSLAGLLALLIAVAFWATTAAWNRAAQMQAHRHSFIGTWTTDSGVILQFRPDMTARIRYPSSPNAAVTNVHWDIDGHHLVLRDSPRSTRIAQASIFGLSWKSADTDDRLVIGNTTRGQVDLEILSKNSARSKHATKWTRTDDAAIDVTD